MCEGFLASCCDQLGEVERRLTQLEALVGGEEMTVVCMWGGRVLVVLTRVCFLPQSSVAGGQDSKDKDLSVSHVTIT